MRSRFDCLLDGLSLSQVDERLCLVDIVESSPDVRWQTARPARGSGLLVTDCHRRALEVQLRFVIRETLPEGRAQVMERLGRWCNGHHLQISTRPGRWLHVQCTQWPCVSSALQWTQTLSVTFTAWGVPYWQSEQWSYLRLDSVKPEGEWFVFGSAPCAPVCVRLKNTSSAVCNTVSIICGETEISLAGLGLLGGETLKLLYDAEDTLSITVESTSGQPRSALSCRSAKSSDDLTLECGKHSKVKIESAQKFSAECSVRGRWL